MTLEPDNVISPLKLARKSTSNAELRRLGVNVPETCQATTRSGEPCSLPPRLGQRVCRMHGGSSPQAEAAAAERVLSGIEEAQNLFMARLIQRLESPEADLMDPKLLLDGVERLTKLRELLEGRATERRDTSVISKADEAWEVLEAKLLQLGEKRRQRAAVLGPGGSSESRPA